MERGQPPPDHLLTGFPPRGALSEGGQCGKPEAMLILASSSPTRKALLAGAGLRFDTSPAKIDERAIEFGVLGKGGSAVDVARSLASAKAAAVSLIRPDAAVIGADQVLALGSELLHKPADMTEARQQLERLKRQRGMTSMPASPLRGAGSCCGRRSRRPV